VSPDVQNRELGRDYVRRASARLHALDALFEAESWADVVRESQEVVELTLKGLLLAAGVQPPRVHDVSAALLEARERIPEALAPQLETLAHASRQLRRDRELAFYGAVDLLPTDFYTRRDAEQARESARNTVASVAPHIEGP
jgi:HEPN domain-containing protein